MNIEPEGQDPELTQRSHLSVTRDEGPIDNCRHEDYSYSFAREKYNFPMNHHSPTTTGSTSITTTTTTSTTSSSSSSIPNLAPISGRNKRKNFNPRYTSTSPMEEEALPTKTDYQHHQQLGEGETMSVSSKSPPDAPDYGDDQPLELTPWMQMFHHYDQFVKATGLAQYQQQIPALGQAAEMSEWMRKFGATGTVPTIRDFFKAYQGSAETSLMVNENGRVPEADNRTPPSSNCLTFPMSNGTDRRESPPQIPYHSSTRGSPVKDEPPQTSPSHSQPQEDAHYPTNLTTSRRESPPQADHHHQWSCQTGTSSEGPEVCVPKIECSSYHDDSSDYGDRSQPKASSSFLQLHPHWSGGENFKKTTTDSEMETRIKSECDDTDADNTLYDEDDYPPSPKDFPDSTNDDEDDDDAYSVNMFCDDEQSTAEDQVKMDDGEKSAAQESSDADENRNCLADKEGSCSSGSLKISVRNLGGFFDQGHGSVMPSKVRGAIDEKTLHYFVRNMIKFTSYLECQNEVCRLESLREHYHCYDFPCFGKILSKKEEVIRHVKWHRKRVESLNHGFMRFSSSDDCSTTFGGTCQHNRKQTHYHCFQPNCDRVYISTSDVQMHSNFHRKDSAIHKEGFQRFRANEQCSADYCMFAGQKTTHFHCRRDNCRYTFKNKADMEKHKTYHIKDLKLAQDGFKKFLKNEACPYKQCRFSKVCNHIHCARENCFYVLHSSGQLLSHKRKHERMDNEQTYCRYKMLAVKAALLGNAAAAAAVSPEVSPQNLTNSLLQLRDLEIGGLIPSPKKDLFYKEEAPLSLDFLQNIKKRHEELLKVNFNSSPVHRMETYQSDSPPQPSTNDDATQLTPSVIQQFFTKECPQGGTTEEPINLKNEEATDQTQCPWKDRSEQHLHCILKDCRAVIANNILDISAHIRMHGFHRGPTVAPVAAPQAPAEAAHNSSEAGTSHSPMQITTIDGFFNRKRGRPPKNRFVEVYKNAQQSPQAIFTSFKLEKQTLPKDCNATCVSTPSPSYPQPVGYHIEQRGLPAADEATTQRSTQNPFAPQSPNRAQVSTAAPASPIASQFTTHKANEHCGDPGGRCPLAMQHHYHCACSPDCTFVTVERDLLSVHLERQHTIPSFADIISKKFKRFDRNIGLDCGITDCRLRKTRPHLHCRQCYRQISPFDLETHVCGSPDQRPMSSASPTKKTPPGGFYSSEYRRHDQHLHTELTGENFIINSTKGHLRDYGRMPSVTFSTLTELRRKVSEMEPEPGAVVKRSHEDEKILVVRAAGTYFPENTTELSGPSSHSQQQKQLSSSSSISEYTHLPPTPTTSAYCSTPYCKMKRKPHEHCEYCDQSFVDAAKIKAHRLKHMPSTIKPDTDHLMSLHSTEATEETPPPSYLRPPPPPSSNEARPPAYDDQPQDLSLSPNVPAPAAQDERAKPGREQQFTASSQLPGSPAGGHFPNLFHPDLMCSISMQNFQLAQLASLYQQNPYYNQHLYPFLGSAASLSRQQQQHRQVYRMPGSKDKPYFPAPSDCPTPTLPPAVPPFPPAALSVSGQFPFLSPLLMAQASETAAAAKQTHLPPLAAIPPDATGKTLKRKLTNGNDDFSAFIDALSPSAKKQMQLAAGLAAAAAAAATTASAPMRPNRPGCSGGTREQHGQHFKIKDEQVPTGYLKFRFNEDCYFPKCNYRNHQSHFHCDRNDCHYSFCDKTRFVQHTARHERLDKLMGNDFRQYRASMNCGYENCPYFKNLGSANKSSHFHCLKCDFICSDTNKVVAHRRQHSKMEYIRMAGFRKVTNSEKCNSTFEATVPINGNDHTGTVECSYSQKQTHYHCLVCDVSVLSRAQLASHKHKT